MNSSHDLRARIIEVTGYKTVYTQPPSGEKMTYPCVLIRREAADVKRADNKAYNILFRYTVTRISKNDDDGAFVAECLNNFPNCYYDRSYVTEGLYHDVLYIYY